MPKLKLSDRERQNRTLIAIIQSGKVMEGVSVEKLSKLTGIPKSTLYQGSACRKTSDWVS